MDRQVPDSTRTSIFTGQFALICLTYFACFIILHLLIPTLPLYVKDLGGRDSDIGLVLGISSVSALAVRFVAGPVLDLWGRRLPLSVGAVLTLGTVASYLFASSIPHLIILRFFQGIGFSIVTTATSVLAADHAPQGRRGEAMSYYGNFASIAMAVAPGAGLWLITHPMPPLRGFALLFVVCVLVGLLQLVSALQIKETRRPAPRGSAPAGRRRIPTIFSRDALPIAFAMFFGAYTLGAISSFVPIYLSTANPENVPIFFLVYATVMVISRPLVGRIADRADKRLVVLPLMLFCACGTTVFAIAPTLTVALVSALIFGSGYGALNATLLALTVEVVRPQERGAALSVFNASVDLGLAVGSISLGLVADFYGYGSVFVVAGLVGLIGLVYLLLYQRQPRRSPVPSCE